jgi:hypothetical protein
MDVPFIEQVSLELGVDLTRSSHRLPRQRANHVTAQRGAMPRPSVSTMATVKTSMMASVCELDNGEADCFIKSGPKPAPRRNDVCSASVERTKQHVDPRHSFGKAVPLRFRERRLAKSADHSDLVRHRDGWL